MKELLKADYKLDTFTVTLTCFLSLACFIFYQLTELPEIFDYVGDLQNYYDACDEYWKLRTKLQVNQSSISFFVTLDTFLGALRINVEPFLNLLILPNVMTLPECNSVSPIHQLSRPAVTESGAVSPACDEVSDSRPYHRGG